MLGDRLLRLATARREPVGDRQQRDVDLDGIGRLQIAVQRAPRERHIMDEEAEPQVVARERGDVCLELLAATQSGQDLARQAGALAVVAEERRRAVFAAAERRGLGDVVQQRAEAQREAAVDLVAERLCQQRRDRDGLLGAEDSARIGL